MRVCSHSRLSLIRRAIAAYAAVAIAFVSISTPANAALPALALVEPAAAFASGLVLQTIGRQAVISVGVAANDASWLPLLSYAARTFGILRVAGAVNSYEIPLQEDVAIEQPPPSGGESQSNALAYTNTAIRYLVNSTYPACVVSPGNSNDGQQHQVPPGSYDIWTLAEKCDEALQHFVGGLADLNLEGLGAQASWTSPQTGYTYWFERVCIRVEYGSGGSDCIWNSNGSKVTIGAPMDGVKTFVRTPEGFVYDPADPDWTEEEKATFEEPKRLQFTNNASNPSEVLEVAANDSVLAISVGAAAGSGLVKTRLARVDNTAKVFSVVESAAPNVSPAAAASAAIESAVEGGSGTGTGTGTGSWPDDYARQATLQSVDSGIGLLHSDLTNKDSVDDPTIPGSSEFTDSFFSGTFDALKGWQLPGHSSQCPVGSFDWNGTTYSINAHCQLVADHFNALQAAMTVVWSLLALFIVLRA